MPWTRSQLQKSHNHCLRERSQDRISFKVKKRETLLRQPSSANSDSSAQKPCIKRYGSGSGERESKTRHLEHGILDNLENLDGPQNSKATFLEPSCQTSLAASFANNSETCQLDLNTMHIGSLLENADVDAKTSRGSTVTAPAKTASSPLNDLSSVGSSSINDLQVASTHTIVAGSASSPLKLTAYESSAPGTGPGLQGDVLRNKDERDSKLLQQDNGAMLTPESVCAAPTSRPNWIDSRGANLEADVSINRVSLKG